MIKRYSFLLRIYESIIKEIKYSINKMSLTGIKDGDILILLQLKDRELGPVCQANKYVASLCKDDNFWKIRIVNKIKRAFENNLSKSSKIFTTNLSYTQ
jgi:hypothetical protein